MTQAIIQSPIGPLKLTVEKGYVIGLEFCKDKGSKACITRNKTTSSHVPPEDLKTLQQTRSELDLYFKGLLKEFTVPVKLYGPSFYLKVWEELKRIGYGETRTYSEVAKTVGSPRAARAVGNACAANPVAIIVPCHRVLAKDGLGGFGVGLETKTWLLKHESSNVLNLVSV